jgi:hypothetical protein
MGSTERPAVLGFTERPAVMGSTERPAVMGFTERPAVMGSTERPTVMGSTERPVRRILKALSRGVRRAGDGIMTLMFWKRKDLREKFVYIGWLNTNPEFIL